MFVTTQKPTKDGTCKCPQLCKLTRLSVLVLLLNLRYFGLLREGYAEVNREGRASATIGDPPLRPSESGESRSDVVPNTWTELSKSNRCSVQKKKREHQNSKDPPRLELPWTELNQNGHLSLLQAVPKRHGHKGHVATRRHQKTSASQEVWTKPGVETVSRR